MEKKIRTDQSGDGSRLPYGWNKGDTCVMITNKAKKSTSEYIVENYDGVYFGVRSHTGVYYGKNVPLFRRNGYRKPGAMIP